MSPPESTEDSRPFAGRRAAFFHQRQLDFGVDVQGRLFVLKKLVARK